MYNNISLTGGTLHYSPKYRSFTLLFFQNKLHMKLFNTLTFTLLSITLSFAQITIDASDAPSFDTEFYYAVDTILSEVGPGPDGAGQNWDFTGLDTNELITTTVVDPTLTPAGDMFTNASFAFESDGLYSYAGIDEAGLYALGGSALQQGFEFTVGFDPPQQLLANPTTLGTTFTSQFAFELEIDGSAFGVDSVRVRQSGTAEAAVNASGTLTVPAGSFETLRLTTESVTMDSIWIKFFGTWQLLQTTIDTAVTHEWWTEAGIGTVATLEMDTEGNPLSLQYLVDFFQPITPPVADFFFDWIGNGALQFIDQSTNDPTEWLWDFGDGNTSQEKHPQHAYEETGTYDVCLTVTNGGGSDTACEELSVTVTSTSEASHSKPVRIYPNPVKDRLNVYAKKITGQPAMALVYNTEGQLLLQFQAVAIPQNWNLNVSQLMPGTYFLEIMVEGEKYQALPFSKQ